MNLALTPHYRASRGARIIHCDAGGFESSTDLTLAGVHIGRADDCAIRTSDPQVSRRNCKISFSGGRWCIEDLGSANGTFVNGERITRAVLHDGDLIRCGSFAVRFAEGVAAPSAAPPTLALADGEPPRPAGDVRVESLRQRLDDLERRDALHEEEVRVVTALAKELRDELLRCEESRAQVTAELAAAREDLEARERQLQRAHEEAEASRREAADARGELAAAKQRSDAGWRELSHRDAELEDMRRIMTEQDRLLAERALGLTTLEAALQALRAEREQLLRENAAARVRMAAM